MLYKDVVGSLVSAIDVLDRYTEGHGKRVSDLSRLLARELGLGARETEAVATAGLLHDVGKLGIPSEILRKPGRLSPSEYEVMKRHPGHSARILGAIRGFEDITTMALRHHERWDGGGYPDGLAGEAIPLGAQIIQVADSLDAMTSTRSYRPARGWDEAVAEVGACSGGQFHPAVAAAALALDGMPDGRGT